MMKYFKDTAGKVWAFEADGSQDAFIPKGATPITEAEALARPTFVPSVVSMRQARLELLATGDLARVDAAIASLPSPKREQARIEWEYATVVERNSALTTLLGVALSLDSAAMDARFISAAAR